MFQEGREQEEEEEQVICIYNIISEGLCLGIHLLKNSELTLQWQRKNVITR